MASVNGKLKSEDCLHYPKLFRIFALSNNEGYSSMHDGN